MEIAQALGIAAPYYNLLMVAIVIILFAYLINVPNKKLYHKPWWFLFFALVVFIIEEAITTVKIAGGFEFSTGILFSVLETIIVALFIYMLLLQREYLVKEGHIKKK